MIQKMKTLMKMKSETEECFLVYPSYTLITYSVDPRFRMEKEAIVSHTRYGLLFYFLTAAILAVMILTYYREPTEPETRVTGFLEGRVYSENDDGSIRLWDIRDTQVPSYAYQQVFVPTVVRVVENQSQGRCQDRTIN